MSNKGEATYGVAAYYAASVADVCLVCPLPECRAPDYGCAAYRRALEEERGRRRRALGLEGEGSVYDAPSVKAVCESCPFDACIQPARNCPLLSAAVKEERARRSAAHQRNRRTKLLAAGRCTVCGRERAVPGRTMCVHCLAKTREKNNAYYRRKADEARDEQQKGDAGND